jgi:hypothetical protein
VASGTASRFAGLRSLPSAAFRAFGLGVGFVVLVAAVFAGVGAWQDREPAPDEQVAAPEPSPVPPPTPAPEPDDDEDDEPDTEGPGDGGSTDGEGEGEGEGGAVEPPPVTGPRPADVSVQLLNGIGADGAAGVARVRTTLADAGFRIAASRDGRAYDVTTIFYTVGFEAEARLVGQVLDVRAINPMTDLPPERRLSSSVMVHVVVGADRR